MILLGIKKLPQSSGMAKILSILFLVLSCGLTAQQQLNIPILKNVDVSNQILELELSSQTSEEVLLGWQTKDGTQETHAVFVSPGITAVDLSQFSSWNGHINFLVTNNKKVKAALAPLTMRHEISGFFQTTHLSPSSINLAADSDFKGLNMTTIMLILFVLFFIGAMLMKVAWKKALFIAFVSAWAFQSLKMMKHEIDIFGKLRTDNYEMTPFLELAEFVKKVKPVIKDQRWTKADLSGVHNSYLKYHLWESPFVSRKRAKTNDYLITTTPRKRKVLVRHGEFCLVQIK